MFRLLTYRNNRLPNGYRFWAIGVLKVLSFDLFYLSLRRSSRQGVVYSCVKLCGFEAVVGDRGFSVGFCGRDLVLKVKK